MMMTHQVLLLVSGFLFGVLLSGFCFMVLGQKFKERSLSESDDLRAKLKKSCKKTKDAEDKAEGCRKNLGKALSEGEIFREKTRKAQIDLEDANDQIEHYSEQARSIQEALNDCLGEADHRDNVCREQAQKEREKALVEFVKKILPTLDGIERELDDVQKPFWTREHNNMNKYRKQLEQVMVRSGFQPIDPKGKVVDHETHRVIGEEVREGIDPGTVISVYRKGWLFDGKIVRFADVVVAK